MYRPLRYSSISPKYLTTPEANIMSSLWGIHKQKKYKTKLLNMAVSIGNSILLQVNISLSRCYLWSMYNSHQRSWSLGYNCLLQSWDSLQHRAHLTKSAIKSLKKVRLQNNILGSLPHPIDRRIISNNAKGTRHNKQLALHFNKGSR